MFWCFKINLRLVTKLHTQIQRINNFFIIDNDYFDRFQQKCQKQPLRAGVK
jgi:hypothetical protein